MVVRTGGGVEEGKADGGGQELGKVKVCQTYQLSEPWPHQWEINRALIGINNGHACECMSSRVKVSKVVPPFKRFYILLSPFYHHSVELSLKLLPVCQPGAFAPSISPPPVCDNENLFSTFPLWLLLRTNRPQK